jgi:hypothetical protein
MCARVPGRSLARTGSLGSAARQAGSCRGHRSDAFHRHTPWPSAPIGRGVQGRQTLAADSSTAVETTSRRVDVGYESRVGGPGCPSRGCPVRPPSRCLCAQHRIRGQRLDCMDCDQKRPGDDGPAVSRPASQSPKTTVFHRLVPKFPHRRRPGGVLRRRLCCVMTAITARLTPVSMRPCRQGGVRY